ncbi:GDP-L-fucose synthase, partial [bacterium]|nr:GDP-L-fucose synthase [bacterium]
MNLTEPIFVAGHRGMVGSAIVRRLSALGFSTILTRTHAELDLTDQAKVREFFKEQRPTHVVLAAAKVGGIYANSNYPAEFIYQNLMMEANVIHSAYESGVQKLLFLGSSCIYPKFAPQPMTESVLLTGALEPTNQAYAVAKISGIVMCQAYAQQYGARFISAMPTNLYGPNDNYELQNSHVLPALIRKIHEAKVAGHSTVEIWGTGTPRREFLHVDDLADACVMLLQTYDDPEIVNVGCGDDITIGDLATLIADVVGYSGQFR